MEILIDDSSPQIAYYANSTSEGWSNNHQESGGSSDPYLKLYNKGTFHSTMGDGDHMVFTFNGTGVALYGSKRPNHEVCGVRIDEENEVYVSTYAKTPELQRQLFMRDDLPANQEHTITVTNYPNKRDPNAPQSNSTERSLDIDHVVVTLPISGPLYTTILDDTSSSVTYDTMWRKVNDTDAGFYNSTAHSTSRSSSVVDIRFSGTSVQLFGTIGGVHGNYSVSLDGASEIRYNASNWEVLNGVPLYTASGLTDDQHVVRLVNRGGTNQTLEFDYAVVNSTVAPTTRPQGAQISTATIAAPVSSASSVMSVSETPNAVDQSPASSDTSSSSADDDDDGSQAGLIAGSVTAGVVALLLVIVVLFLFCRTKRRPPRSHKGAISRPRPRSLRSFEKATPLPRRLMTSSSHSGEERLLESPPLPPLPQRSTISTISTMNHGNVPPPLSGKPKFIGPLHMPYRPRPDMASSPEEKLFMVKPTLPPLATRSRDKDLYSMTSSLSEWIYENSGGSVRSSTFMLSPAASSCQPEDACQAAARDRTSTRPISKSSFFDKFTKPNLANLRPPPLALPTHKDRMTGSHSYTVLRSPNQTEHVMAANPRVSTKSTPDPAKSRHKKTWHSGPKTASIPDADWPDDR
ncbi:hypothetical protein I316_00427 [Kwoniella heveanensis BCC8398]|uniref:Transmembrane protein n=1 Tax=Kwoniella heveanensis BCC8398 TaxID=1296120 RepID=A0A1B9H4K7_9TREE|nr:hypothetical protein I316_00427 [Kwoniella heveanensis BCC8398]